MHIKLQAALDAGDFPGALDCCRERLSEHPDDADAHRHLAQLHAASGEPGLAMRHARRACELAPEDPRAWSDLGRVYAQDGKLEDATLCFTEAIRIDPRYADGWHNLGTALKKLGRQADAFSALKHALLLDPTRAETYLNLGNLLIETDQFEDAVRCFERAAKHDPKLAAARTRLAQELSARGKVKRAESLFRQSLGLDPDQVQGWFGLGRTLEDLGVAEGALGCYLNVIARRPDHAQAIGQYLALVRGDAEARVLDPANRAIASPDATDEAKALIGYGLAKYHDRRREYAQAAAAGLMANAARRRKAGPLDRDKLTARIDGIIGTYTAEFFREHRRLGLGNDQPVFIVGLPRSGTTLIEQILAAHPWLHGAGELPALSRVATQALADTDDQPWQAALKLDRTKSLELAHEYLRALRDGAPKGRLRISDKSPLNFFHLAFAALLFPGARVIHCRRASHDNALSIWMENFNADQRYATDFDDLAFYTAQYRRLMAHWRNVLPLPILDLQYEETATDVEAQARRMLEFLGAPWDTRCLHFHRSERAVQTPSRWQVREPIYTRSVGRWKAYAEHLPGLVLAFARTRDPVAVAEPLDR
ncbi:MAG: tetratricopeptide repeat-containing sulfotransferase family protein [Gammaproteobacteria bacterium]